MKTVCPSRLLKLALIADAVVSGAVAVLQLAAPGWLSELLHLPRVLLVETGGFLVAYTILLVVLARSARVWFSLIAIVVIGNVGWAASCVALLASGVLSPSALGKAFVVVQAVAVLLFAALQAKGLSSSSTAPASSTARA